jgi:uncharacterized membrane protein YraQ (UPF0718 family)/copper chaperone CopZ
MTTLFLEIWRLFLEMSPYMLFGLFFVGILHLYFTKDFVLKHVGDSSIKSVFKAALFGIPLPLCSCGVIPTAVYMKKNGASSASTSSFLISTPQTGIDSIVATYGMMGGIFAIFRPFAALIMGIVGGGIVSLFDKPIIKTEQTPRQNNNMFTIIGQTATTQTKSQDTCEDGTCDCSSESESVPTSKFAKFGKYAFVDFLDDISVQFIIGVIISGLISYFIPDNFFDSETLSSGILGMLLMILVGIPMYICATASIPIAVALMMKGFSPGVAFVFLAVGPATNAASLTILLNTLGKKIVSVYLATLIIMSIIMGYLLDLIFSFSGSSPEMIAMHHNHDLLSDDLKLISGIVFGVLLLLSVYRKYIGVHLSKEKPIADMELTVTGMSCNHCKNNVESALTQLKGVESVSVNLSTQKVIIKGNTDRALVIETIEKVGYKVIQK